jgi:hypothetical protein
MMACNRLAGALDVVEGREQAWARSGAGNSLTVTSTITPSMPSDPS